MNVNILIDEADIAGAQRVLVGISEGATKAIVTAINKTATTTKVQVRKRLAQDLTATSKEIGSHLVVNKANYSKLSGTLGMTGKPLPLIKYKTGVQGKKGVKARIYKTSDLKVIFGAFYATMKSGHKGLFVRKYTDEPSYQRKPVTPGRIYSARTLTRKYRLPIREYFGPRLEDILAKDEYIDPLSEDAGDLLAVKLGEQIDDVLRRYREL